MVLLIDGQAGIGKTTIWSDAVRSAQEVGWRVLSCRPAPSDASLAYVGLTDMLSSVPDDVLTGLPGPQRKALAFAPRRIGNQPIPMVASVRLEAPASARQHAVASTTARIALGTFSPTRSTTQASCTQPCRRAPGTRSAQPVPIGFDPFPASRQRIRQRKIHQPDRLAGRAANADRQDAVITGKIDILNGDLHAQDAGPERHLETVDDH